MLGASQLSTGKGTSSSSQSFPGQWCASGKALAYVLMQTKSGCNTGREGFLPGSCARTAEEHGAARGQCSLGDPVLF